MEVIVDSPVRGGQVSPMGCTVKGEVCGVIIVFFTKWVDQSWSVAELGQPRNSVSQAGGTVNLFLNIYNTYKYLE